MYSHQAHVQLFQQFGQAPGFLMGFRIVPLPSNHGTPYFAIRLNALIAQRSVPFLENQSLVVPHPRDHMLQHHGFIFANPSVPVPAVWESSHPNCRSCPMPSCAIPTKTQQQWKSSRASLPSTTSNLSQGRKTDWRSIQNKLSI